MTQPALLDVDPHARRADDFYETQAWQVAALLRRIVLRPAYRYVEPAAGNGAIARFLQDAHHTAIWSNDLVRREAALDSVRDACDPATWATIAASWGPIDVTISNLPFTQAFPIAQLALQYSRVAVILLLRHTWDEPTLERADWLAAHPLACKIVMPRAHYRGGAGSDSATHSWFLWHTGALIAASPHMTVTPAERDALIQQYGDGPYRGRA